MNTKINIDLSKYKLIPPSNIIKHNKQKIMYDIQTENNTFVIHTDSINILSHNCDGQHIASLIINFFNRWFPYIIKEERLFKLVTPLIVCDYNNKRKYFYSNEEFVKFSKDRKLSNTNYLKGLGSLSLNDWEFVMKNKSLFQIVKDRSSNKFLEIAFGNEADKRKKWLEGIT